MYLYRVSHATFPLGLENLEEGEGIFQSGSFEQTGKVLENHTKYWKSRGSSGLPRVREKSGKSNFLQVREFWPFDSFLASLCSAHVPTFILKCDNPDVFLINSNY